MEPYDAGKDCAMNGPDTANCHFSLFSTPERMAEWEAGKRAGDQEKDHAD